MMKNEFYMITKGGCGGEGKTSAENLISSMEG